MSLTLVEQYQKEAGKLGYKWSKKIHKQICEIVDYLNANTEFGITEIWMGMGNYLFTPKNSEFEDFFRDLSYGYEFENVPEELENLKNFLEALTENRENYYLNIADFKLVNGKCQVKKN